jgi:Peptidase family M49
MTIIFFQYVDKDVEDIQYITYLLMARAGLRALEFYDPATKKHGQAHMQARYEDTKIPNYLHDLSTQAGHHSTPYQIRHCST